MSDRAKHLLAAYVLGFPNNRNDFFCYGSVTGDMDSSADSSVESDVDQNAFVSTA